MARLKSLYTSIVGKKILAAVTGLVLFGFLIGHVAGNLKTFTGTNSDGVPAIDEYGEYLRKIGHPLVPEYFVLWSARIVLLIALIVHVLVVAQLALHNRDARPQGYARQRYVASSWAARWMMFSGLLILGFVIFHILHFTTGTIVISQFEYGKIYSNFYYSFGFWPVSLFYIAAMIALGFHLYHGIWSLFQTLGLDNPDRNTLMRRLALVATLAITVGFSAVPVAFVAGVMPEPPTQQQTVLEQD